MTDALNQFRDAMRSFGLEPPLIIEAGKFHRFPGIGKQNGNTAGWCKLFEDGMGGSFGDLSSGLSEHWQANGNKPHTPEEWKSFKNSIAKVKAQAEAEHKTRQSEAALKAAAIWKEAVPASDDHPYLVRKDIHSNGARRQNGNLVIPLLEGDTLHSLQFIGADGSKRFLTGGRVTGCYFIIGITKEASAMCLAEGFSTGATLNEATGIPVAVAFNAGNLKPVAKAMRERFPELPLIVCADDDAATEGNPGLTKGEGAARAVSGRLAIPDFQRDRPDGATDFNDMAARLGLDAVACAVQNSTVPEGNNPGARNGSEFLIYKWPKPIPLISKLDPKPYPIDALPETIRKAVEEVQKFTKAPVPLVASSALGALSVALQAYVDVKRAENLSGPVSLYFLTIAASGERKSTCDRYFTKAIREYQDRQAKMAKPALANYSSGMTAWEAKRAGMIDKIRQFSKKGLDISQIKEVLREHEIERPIAPRVPRLLRGDETPENLAWVLSHEWPSAGIISAEAGSIFGAHGMGKDSIMRNLALLNTLWDGGIHSIGRRTSDSFIVQGARLTMALQIQEATLRHFFDRSQGLVRGSGFLARFLIAWPVSTQGTRFFTEAPKSWLAFEDFNRRIGTILDQPAPVDKGGLLCPPLIPLAPDAKEAWVAFHDAVERDLAGGGNLHDVQDVASKSAENAARLAALFQFFDHGACGAVDWEDMQGASRIITWHLNESLRFFGELALPDELSDSVRLDNWLIEYCSRNRTQIIPRREVQRHVTPNRLRIKHTLEVALKELTELDRVRLIQKGRRKEIHVNPALINRAIE